MKLMFYGAAREVTGSCHGIEVRGKRYLVDCGMQQGSGAGPARNFAFHPGEIEAVFMTHAHIDHSGRLPLLVKQGFKGKIFATQPTCELLGIMLRDSAHIHETEAGWRSRKSRRAGDEQSEPYYTVADAEQVFPLLVPCQYGQMIDVGDGISIRFQDAGHLLGSAFIEMWLTEENLTKKLVFSGDIGTPDRPIIKDPSIINEADFAVMESTYGDRSHDPMYDNIGELANVIDSTMARGGNVICPAFAVGRTQELLYIIREIKERGLVKSNPDFLVYLDSPLASAATKIYSGDNEGYLDSSSAALVRAGGNPIVFDGLRITSTADESKLLNDDRTPKVIISSSGMCEAGRIRHHLKHNLWRRECAVVFSGYQAQGTLGRIIAEGEKSSISLFGDEIIVRCAIHTIRGMSAHADQEGLLKWADNFVKKPQRVFVVHGENEVCESFALQLIEAGHFAVAPKHTAIFDMLTDKMVFEGVDLVSKRDVQPIGVRRESAAYQKLMLAGTRLMEAITRNRGGANKDLSKFEEQINALTNEWDR